MLEEQIRQEAHDARSAKIVESVTKQWEDTDNNSIIDSINSQDLEELVYSMRNEDLRTVGEELVLILRNHYIDVAVDEVY